MDLILAYVAGCVTIYWLGWKWPIRGLSSEALDHLIASLITEKMRRATDSLLDAAQKREGRPPVDGRGG